MCSVHLRIGKKLATFLHALVFAELFAVLGMRLYSVHYEHRKLAYFVRYVTNLTVS